MNSNLIQKELKEKIKEFAKARADNKKILAQKIDQEFPGIILEEVMIQTTDIYAVSNFWLLLSNNRRSERMKALVEYQTILDKNDISIVCSCNSCKGKRARYR